MDINQVFKKKLGSSKSYIALVNVNINKYEKVNKDILKYLINIQKNPGVYVAVNKPYSVIQKELEKLKINPGLLVPIDCISTKFDENTEKDEKCLIIGNPEGLSDIGLAIDQAVNSIRVNEKFLYFDSINTLLIHNNISSVAQFSYYLVRKIREWKIKCIIINVNNNVDKELVGIIAPLCDARFDIKGD